MRDLHLDFAADVVQDGIVGMSTAQWLPVELKPMADARRQLLNVAQWLARIANSYGASELGNSHPVLRWREDGSITTSEFLDRYAVELHLPDLSMTFCERGRPVPHELDVEERSPAQVEAWILVELLHRGIDRDCFSLALPYDVPGLMTGDAFDYSPDSCRLELEQLTSWYRNAGTALARVAARVGAATEVVCLPSNLHLAIFLPVDAERPSGTIRLGFTPGDQEVPEPYFYAVSEERQANESPHVVLTASEIVTSKDPVQFIDAALDEAIASARRQAMH